MREEENMNRSRQEQEAKMATDQKEQQRKDKIEKYLRDLRASGMNSKEKQNLRIRRRKCRRR
jgi:hypothetical protein